MYELTRVRLHAVGPPTARYQDVVLDLRDVGLPVPKPVRQDSLFAEAPDGVPRRPSPASVLFLENGGGKSVLIKLIFSVILPGRRQVVGTTNTRVLENFVGAKDVAHVVLEWQHTVTGQRVITGKVSEWRGHTVSSDSSKLIDRWYSLRPTESVDLDSLPFTQDGRLVTLTGFHERLVEAHREQPELQLEWEKSQSDWTDKLIDLGLDPELFRYQRAMNAGEGEAADAFNFRTDHEFVDFLLRAVTPEEDPRGLADLLGSYAVRLAQRGQLQAERDFVAGALDRLAPLATLEADAEAARSIATRERLAGQRFAAEVAVRHARETGLLGILQAERSEVREQEVRADHRQEALQSVVIELRRLVAELRLHEAERHKATLEEAAARAELTRSAWRDAPVELRFRAARDKRGTIEEIVSEQEERARPALRVMDDAAGRLARALLAAARRAEAEAGRLDELAVECDRKAERAQEEHDDAVREEERQRGLKKQADAEIAEVRRAVEDRVRAGVLADGADVPVAARAAADSAAAAEREVVAALEKLSALRVEHERAVGAVIAAERERADAEQELARAGGRVEEAASVATRLTADERLIALLGGESVELDADAPALAGRTAEAVAVAESRQVVLRGEHAVDERALDALGSGGLLPPAEDVSRALEVLEEKGITAWSGWRYLSGLEPADQAATLARFPHLVGGIVLNSADSYPRAEQVLTEALLLPRSVVPVGDTAVLLDVDAAAPRGIGFLVPPNPAMYDEEAAKRERKSIQDRQTARVAELDELRARLEGDRSLHERLKAWLRDYPSGTVARLGEEQARAGLVLETVLARLEGARAAAEAITEEERTRRELLPELRKRESDAAERARDLERLAGQVARIPGWAEKSAAAGERAEEAGRLADDARVRADTARRQAGEHRRTADDHRRTVSACRAELGEIPRGGAVTETDSVPDEPVETLRNAYRSATAAYEKVQVGSDLLAGLEHARQDEAAARREVERLPAPERALIGELLAGPDGTDTAAMDAATERARRAVELVSGELNEARERFGELRSEYRQFTPQDRSLEPYGRPRDIAHGEELVARATVDRDAAHAAFLGLRDTRIALDDKVANADLAMQGFQGLVESLVDLSADDSDPDTAPFATSLDDARTRYKSLRTTLTEAKALLDEAESAVRSAAGELARYAAERQFDQVESHVRRQLLAVGVDRLPSYAREWAAALRPRLRTLTDDLAQIDVHRANIVARLKGMVETAIGTLRSAQRLSRLPDHLGDWSGQEFLRVRFDDLDENVLVDRLGEVVDESSTKDEKSARRDGMTLLLHGVRAAMPKGVRVEMLKPDAVLRTERVRVSEIKDVFSGGQQLTAAIILYCTMAALRANDRGHGRQRHSGVLFLDNPIGRASAGYLLELQLKVAEALGVQLIYTTGLFDTDALSVFPLIVRLRNDADLRMGMKYLSMDSEVRKPLDALGEPDGSGRLSATRLFARRS